MSPILRRIVLAVALLSLLALAWTGLSGGWSQLAESHTRGQQIQTACQLAYGLFATLSVVTTFIARRWSRLCQAGWVVSITLAGGLASVAWGDTSVAVGLLAGGASLLVSLAIIWLLRTGSRGLTRT